ncbi:hypothetical protein OROHE_018767 [Orobanche hederae]
MLAENWMASARLERGQVSDGDNLGFGCGHKIPRLEVG